MAKKIVEEGKALLKSKFFWFGILFIVNGVAAFFGFKEFQPGENLEKIVEVIVGALIIFMRLKTSQPITKLK